MVLIRWGNLDSLNFRCKSSCSEAIQRYETRPKEQKEKRELYVIPLLVRVMAQTAFSKGIAFLAHHFTHTH